MIPPTAAVVAMAEPEIAPKKVQVAMEIYAMLPRTRPKIAVATLTSLRDKPP